MRAPVVVVIEIIAKWYRVRNTRKAYPKALWNSKARVTAAFIRIPYHEVTYQQKNMRTFK